MQQPGNQRLNPIALGAAIAVVALLVDLVMIPMMTMMPMMRGTNTTGGDSMHMSPVVGLVIALVSGFIIGLLVAWIYNAVASLMARGQSTTT